VLRSALDHLEGLADAHEVTRALVADPDSATTLSTLGLVCLSLGGRLRPRLHAVADLAIREEVLRSDIRSSYRSLINWGSRSLSIDYCNGERTDRSLLDEYRHLHAKVAGRITRSMASWDVMYETIASGSGELTLARYEGRLVGGTMVIDGAVTSVYASGAYERETALPLGHWPIMNALLRARSRGARYFDLGATPDQQDRSDKEMSIAFFKRGFTSRVEVRPVWDLSYR
jgi:hypothetical protein